ncbi:MAG: type I 3-dehydroquinate dehydratase [Candidatus Methylacidiphilales bacterium]|nr:type I 3-dehydroquinate dehydratase [Candidatus Methylacidiphilales bacterium]
MSTSEATDALALALDWAEPLLGVGSISTIAGLEILQSAEPCPADLIEVRVDLLLAKGVTLEVISSALKARRHPALITPRIPAEGGKYNWAPGERATVIRTLLPDSDALDLELAEVVSNADIRAVYEEALALGTGVILSAHAIKTPASESTWAAWRATFPQYKANIYKIAGEVQAREDLLRLVAPMVEKPDLPWAVMGLGEGAGRMRTTLTALGSRLIYGYLDEPAVVSQPSLVSLIQQFSA